MKISEILKNTTQILHASGVAEPAREAKSLLAFTLNKNHTFLVAHSEYELSVEEENRFQNFVERRARREPFQYIVGRQEFFGLDFALTPDVLIPRPETEMMVEAAIDFLRGQDTPFFCEIGIGSGCVAVSVLHSIETARAVGSDVSENALKIAKRNAEIHRVAERLELRISDVYDNLRAEIFHLIVANPPYIPKTDVENLQAEVRDFEPRTALTGGDDGLSIVEKIVAGAPRFLRPNGFLLMEIGINQVARVERLFDKKIWAEVEILPDLQRIPRTVKALKK